jgi:hypothetical protein
MQRSCSVEHAHDGIPLSQNFADGHRELSRSVSGVLHCIVRDKVDRLYLPSSYWRFGITLVSVRLRKSHQVLTGVRLRQFATDAARRDKVLRQLVAKVSDQDRNSLQKQAVPPGTGRHLAIRI